MIKLTVTRCPACPFVQPVGPVNLCSLDQSVAVKKSRTPANCPLKKKGGAVIKVEKSKS